MKEISTSIYTFEHLISGKSLYVDKTKYFYSLIKKDRGQFFCSRPRRFGKSLAVSTLEAIFQGKKELFEGLFIYDTDYDWQEYPVVHIDFAGTDLTDQITLTSSLRRILTDCASEYSVTIQADSPANMFADLIGKLYQKAKKPVTLLIDEYDKPLLDHLNTPEEADEWRIFMDNFYQVVKGSEKYLRFVFITGVTKFAKVSIFSKLNNLRDITMSEEYSEMFGYTQQEFEENFAEYIDDAVEKGATAIDGKKLDREGLLSEIRRWYDGFQFSVNGQRMYNPVSVGSFMIEGYRFGNYWFTTGTPSFLTKLLRKNGIVAGDVEKILMSAGDFDAFDAAELAGDEIEQETLLQMLYQTGYITIDRYLPDPVEPFYQMRFPNHEVAFSFKRNLTRAYMKKDPVNFGKQLRILAQSGETADMMEWLKSYFARIPYDIQLSYEKYYQSMVRVIFEMSGLHIVTEEKTNIGRIDAVLDANEHLYIIEFKLNKTADEALAQIDERKYTEKYILPAKEKGQTVHKLGINFCYGKEIRNISEWREEVML